MPFTHFCSGLFALFLRIYRIPLRVLGTDPLLVLRIANISSPLMVCLFILLIFLDDAELILL